jgi:chromosome segregation ATPase
VDYHALAAQLMAQRDAKQEALHELEGKVLRQLRPALEEVMRQEVEIKQLSTALLQTHWEARTFGAKEAQLQNQLEVLRQEHAQRMYSLRAERQAIMADLQSEMGAVKGGREFAQQRQQHAEDVQAIGARLRSLQSYVETAESELSQHEENSTKARAVLPGAARELATLALTFSEEGEQGEAASLFAHSLTILEAAFGSAQPELAAFKSEVQRVVDSGGASNTSGTAANRGGGPIRLGQPRLAAEDA